MNVEFTIIDYREEKGPYWYVYVDDTPVLPDQPLPLEHAIAAFRREVADIGDGECVVELRQCDDQDLEWAGVRVPDDEDGEDPDA